MKHPGLRFETILNSMQVWLISQGTSMPYDFNANSVFFFPVMTIDLHMFSCCRLPWGKAYNFQPNCIESKMFMVIIMSKTNLKITIIIIIIIVSLFFFWKDFCLVLLHFVQCFWSNIYGILFLFLLLLHKKLKFVGKENFTMKWQSFFLPIFNSKFF